MSLSTVTLWTLKVIKDYSTVGLKQLVSHVWTHQLEHSV